MSGRPAALLEVTDLVKHFPVRGGLWRGRGNVVHAVCGASFSLARGETLGLVGESGCGKSTVARLVLHLIKATAGSVRFDGTEVANAGRGEIRAMRRRTAMVFQDPYGSLDPRMTVRRLVSEPLRIQGRYRDGGRRRVDELLERVQLDPDDAWRHPHEFSGGQRQRIGIARALTLDPELVVLDEPVSALDVSIQAGVVNLLEDLQSEFGLAYLFIAHDLSVVRHISDRVAVMYLGQIVETGSRDDVYRRAAHPYTQALLNAVPVPDPVREQSRSKIVLVGEVPSPIDPPTGCRFRTRCPKVQSICSEEVPALRERGQGHPVACHFAELGLPGIGAPSPGAIPAVVPR